MRFSFMFSQLIYQLKYKFLQEVLSNIEGINYYSFDNQEVVPPEETELNSIMIFADVVCERQINITYYFTMGWHNNIDIFYLCQMYRKILKQF